MTRPGHRIRVRGRVQGVGFRPFVWQLARGRGLHGEVSNDAEGVLILACGSDLDGFLAALRAEAPPLAVIEAIETTPTDVPDVPFRIAASGARGSDTGVTPDARICDACAAEALDPSQRRGGYGFGSCTHCGPRYTILRHLPYDRARTSMAAFPMCAACRAEYEQPADRRFHAQPIACPACGPRLMSDGLGDDPIAATAEALRNGAIVAIKGLGGFHLTCDATNATTIARLRERKRRPTKPLALMAETSILRHYAEVSDAADDMLRSPAGPIVLLPMAGDTLPHGIAPGMDLLGWMLPTTPLHLLLCRAVGRPLVMTSGNLSGQPQVTDGAAARRDLGAIADHILDHDRDIARRIDDGVERPGPFGPIVIRRARGRAPGTLPLPRSLAKDPPVAAYGGQMKSAICLTKGDRAMLSHHLGDLDDTATAQAFAEADADCAALFDHSPELIVTDAHPDIRASRHGRTRAETLGLPVVTVDHHHAHMAAALGGNGWDGEAAVGIILDGLGLGPDGTIWGGEVLVGGYASVERAAHLTPAPLPGGDGAAREPWRNALVRLDAAGESSLADDLFPDSPRDMLRQAVRSGINAPLSSSAGRLFDAVAACLGIAVMGQSYEGEAAMGLEALARAGSGPAYDLARDGKQLDPAPLFRAIARDLRHGIARADIAHRFHAGLAQAFGQAARDAATQAGTRTIALSGGCFQNALLLELMAHYLSDLEVLTGTEVPPGDGGLAYGQALVALARLARQ